MSTGQGGRRAVTKTSIATAGCALLALFAPTFAAGHGSGDKLSLKLETTKQSQLTDSSHAVVKAKSKDKQKVVLKLAVKQAGKQKTVAKAKANVKGNKSVRMKLNADGKRLVQSCIPTKLEASASTPGGKELDSDSAAMKRDPARCDGSKPAGVDLENADRCDFISAPGEECLFPYPNDYYTKSDSSTDTGKRLDLSIDSTPANNNGVHVDPTDLNTSDGFSPGALILLHIPGMDTAAAYAATDPVPITNKGEYADANQPVVLIDAATGERQPIWTELDSNATVNDDNNVSTPEVPVPGETTLLIHPTKNLADGHRYIVALRGMKDANGHSIDAPEGFRVYRDDIPTGVSAIESRRSHFESLFHKLGDAGIGRKGLYMSWDFTVASTRNISERMLSIRDRGLATLNDNTPGDGVRDGNAPTFNITTNHDCGADTTGRCAEDIRWIEGTVTVPCFLNQVGCPSGSRFSLDSNGLPTRIPDNTYQARFGCNIPRSAVTETTPGNYTVTNPAPPTMYGHGLFGEYDEVFSANVRQLGNENNMVTCAADWIGMADEDVVPEALPALLDMSKFEPLPDRLQQGFLDFIFLGRDLSMPGGFANDAAFQFGGTSALDPSSIAYYGNSQGGIAGGALTAVEPDVTRSVLYVPGMNYGGLLLTRSVDWPDYAQILYPSYPDLSDRPLLLSMVQSQWDRGEPNGYANHMTTDPLPNTPEHHVLIDMAYGDHQVSNESAQAEALTIGASLRQPAVDSNRLPAGYDQPFFGFPTLGPIPGPAASGNAAFVWDIGPKRPNTSTPDPDDVLGTDPPPLTNTAPNDSFGIDPHDTVIRSSPEIRAQIANFIKPGGAITDPCGAATPCYAAGWTGTP